MVCCLLCFSSDAVDNDPRSMRSNKFQVSLMETIIRGQPCCCISCFCPLCAAYSSRITVLDGNMTKYSCCQGYMNCCCLKAGSCGESTCPHCCLFCEVFCCLGPSMSASRLYMMDKYNLASDPCDNRLIRLNNCCK